MTNTTLEVGEKVRIRRLRSWGICKVVSVHKYGRKIRYAVSPVKGEGITLLYGLKKRDLEVVLA
jgi:hypothetical protein